jgi:hypothetical protein
VYKPIFKITNNFASKALLDSNNLLVDSVEHTERKSIKPKKNKKIKVATTLTKM